MSFDANDLPASGACRHSVRTAVVDAVEQFWTTQPTVAERTITRLAALKNRIATAANMQAGDVSNKLAAKAVVAFIQERFGGAD